MSGDSTTAAWRNRIAGHGDVAPDQLLANPRNWRLHPRDQQRALEGALNEVGWVQQVLVNRTTGHLVDGHLRVQLAISRGEPSVPVTYLDLTEQEELLVLATLDPLGAMARAEKDVLGTLLAELTTGDEALRAMLDDLARESHIDLARDGLTEPDEAPIVPEPADVYVKPGDLWLLDDHRLLCGDSTTDLPRLMDGRIADCIWTDPPYGVDYVGKTRDALTLVNDHEGSDALVRDVFVAALPLVAPRAPFYCASPAGSKGFTFWRAITAAGWQFHQELVWVKDTLVLGHSDYHFRHEPILYGYAPGPGRSGRGRHEGSHWYGGNAQTTVFAIDRPKRSAEHPTMKPVELVARCVSNSTRPGALVLDPFAGSGSTIIAAERLGRACYAADVDPRYVQVAIGRWQAFTGRTAERNR